jgi:hypothetical protein
VYPKSLKSNQPTHASGGPATVSGVDYEIDCALADALILLELHLADPLSDGSITPQARIGATTGLTAWDYRVERVIAVEAKRNATAADIADWFTRSRRASERNPDAKFRLVYGASVGPSARTLSKLSALASEADSEDRLRELATHDGIVAGEWLESISLPFIRSLELHYLEPEALALALEMRARALFSSNPAPALAVARQALRKAARTRAEVRASALARELRAAEVATRDLTISVAIAANDARRVTLYLLARCEADVPIELIAKVVDAAGSSIDDGLRSLATSDAIALQDDGTIRLSANAPRLSAANGGALLNSAVIQGLAAIDRGDPWALRPLSLRVVGNLCVQCADTAPATVATAFVALDKRLKDLGDVALVLRVAEACVRAAQLAPATEHARKGEVQALICGVSWAKQRMHRLEEARADALRSKAMGEDLGWHRNTAFCEKCLGRLLRLEAEGEAPGPERDHLLQSSVEMLQGAIRDFTSLSEMNESERSAEVGACYSLLGRSFLQWGRRSESLDAIESARIHVRPDRKKDSADLWILRGEFELRWGSRQYARDALSQAIGITNAPAFEVAEMRARAFEQRALTAGGAEDGVFDLATARDLFNRLGDREAAARVEFARRVRLGTVPKDVEQAVAGETRAVALQTALVADEHLRAGEGALAYREAIPQAVLRSWVVEARRHTVIGLGAANQSPLPEAVMPGKKRSSAERSLKTVLGSIVAKARNADEAVELLTTELVGALTTVPIDLSALANAIGVREIRASSLVSTGELRDEGDDIVILHSNDLSDVRRRFTVAHELGHAVLVLRGKSPVRAGRDLERFCDSFAAALLLPRHLLPKLDVPVTVRALSAVARQFHVSIPAAAIRLQRVQGGFQTFAVDDGQVIWSAGTIPRGRVSQLPDGIREVVKAILDGNERPAEVFIDLPAHCGMWTLDAERRDAKRAVLAVTPRRPAVRSRTPRT